MMTLPLQLMLALYLKNNRILFVAVTLSLILCSCTQYELQTLTTIADARSSPAKYIDSGNPGDSVGDMLIFAQPLLGEDMQLVGNNSGSCIRTRVDHSFQCQWTLTFSEKDIISGTIQVAGREFDEGSSAISIVGGTGDYYGITGEMISTNNNDGTFTQVLRYVLKR